MHLWLWFDFIKGVFVELDELRLLKVFEIGTPQFMGRFRDVVVIFSADSHEEFHLLLLFGAEAVWSCHELIVKISFLLFPYIQRHRFLSLESGHLCEIRVGRGWS